MLEDKNKIIETKNNELQSKEKSLQSLSHTNKKLINNLESMKKEVDEKLEKISMKAIHEKMKQKQEVQNPLEIVVKIKENEINPKYEFEFVDETKTIAGLEFKKAIVNDRTHNTKFDVYYYDKIKFYYLNSPFKDFGFLLMELQPST